MQNIFLFILSLLVCSISWSCVCYKLGDNFFDTVSMHNAKVNSGEIPPSEALTIVSAKVIKYRESPQGIVPPAMLVRVDHVLQGEIITQEIWVEGDTDGTQCRPMVVNFPLSENYMFALNQDEKAQFYLSGCGEYALNTNVPRTKQAE